MNENVAAFDVDDTLVLWEHDGEDLVSIETPWGNPEQLKPNWAIIEKLKRHHTQGDYVLVWSQSGIEWAKCVVEALGLADCVDQVMAKPKWMYDDMHPSAWTQLCGPWQ